MYIYYYRKKLFSEFFNLDNLWKIHELDEEWHTFRERQKKISSFIETFLPSYTQVPPELNEMVNTTFDPKYLKYFDEFERFMFAKWTSNTELIKNEPPFGEDLDRDKKNQKGKKTKTKIKPSNRLGFVTLLVERGVTEEL